MPLQELIISKDNGSQTSKRCSGNNSTFVSENMREYSENINVDLCNLASWNSSILHSICINDMSESIVDKEFCINSTLNHNYLFEFCKEKNFTLNFTRNFPRNASMNPMEIYHICSSLSSKNTSLMEFCNKSSSLFASKNYPCNITGNDTMTPFNTCMLSLTSLIPSNNSLTSRSEKDINSTEAIIEDYSCENDSSELQFDTQQTHFNFSYGICKNISSESKNLFRLCSSISTESLILFEYLQNISTGTVKLYEACDVVSTEFSSMNILCKNVTLVYSKLIYIIKTFYENSEENIASNYFETTVRPNESPVMKYKCRYDFGTNDSMANFMPMSGNKVKCEFVLGELSESDQSTSSDYPYISESGSSDYLKENIKIVNSHSYGSPQFQNNKIDLEEAYLGLKVETYKATKKPSVSLDNQTGGLNSFLINENQTDHSYFNITDANLKQLNKTTEMVSEKYDVIQNITDSIELNTIDVGKYEWSTPEDDNFTSKLKNFTENPISDQPVRINSKFTMYTKLKELTTEKSVELTSPVKDTDNEIESSQNYEYSTVTPSNLSIDSFKDNSQIDQFDFKKLEVSNSTTESNVIDTGQSTTDITLKEFTTEKPVELTSPVKDTDNEIESSQNYEYSTVTPSKSSIDSFKDNSQIDQFDFKKLEVSNSTTESNVIDTDESTTGTKLKELTTEKPVELSSPVKDTDNEIENNQNYEYSTVTPSKSSSDSFKDNSQIDQFDFKKLEVSNYTTESNVIDTEQSTTDTKLKELTTKKPVELSSLVKDTDNEIENSQNYEYSTVTPSKLSIDSFKDNSQIDQFDYKKLEVSNSTTESNVIDTEQSTTETKLIELTTENPVELSSPVKDTDNEIENSQNYEYSTVTPSKSSIDSFKDYSQIDQFDYEKLEVSNFTTESNVIDTEISTTDIHKSDHEEFTKDNDIENNGLNSPNAQLCSPKKFWSRVPDMDLWCYHNCVMPLPTQSCLHHCECPSLDENFLIRI
ncbi:hypothetical protein GQR58_009910 [Nymphon striatum]|nr:hypothetical protein GQR58_009910 [Nymphon striatum]